MHRRLPQATAGLFRCHVPSSAAARPIISLGRYCCSSSHYVGRCALLLQQLILNGPKHQGSFVHEKYKNLKGVIRLTMLQRPALLACIRLVQSPLDYLFVHISIYERKTERVCVCSYGCMYDNVYVCTGACVCVDVCVDVCVHIHVHVQNMHVCVCVCAHVHVCLCVCVCVE